MLADFRFLVHVVVLEPARLAGDSHSARVLFRALGHICKRDVSVKMPTHTVGLDLRRIAPGLQ